MTFKMKQRIGPILSYLCSNDKVDKKKWERKVSNLQSIIEPIMPLTFQCEALEEKHKVIEKILDLAILYTLENKPIETLEIRKIMALKVIEIIENEASISKIERRRKIRPEHKTLETLKLEYDELISLYKSIHRYTKKLSNIRDSKNHQREWDKYYQWRVTAGGETVSPEYLGKDFLRKTIAAAILLQNVVIAEAKVINSRIDDIQSDLGERSGWKEPSKDNIILIVRFLKGERKERFILGDLADILYFAGVRPFKIPKDEEPNPKRDISKIYNQLGKIYFRKRKGKSLI
ncbi:MAG: hypothetical protein ABSC53_05640 [Bacteroidota bacterium]|jgi:hypothetical protein